MSETHAIVDQWWNQLERLSRVIGQVGPDEVCCEGLTPRQTSILRTLIAGEGARLTDLAVSAGISPSAMTRVIERLEKLGLVQRVRGVGEDGRAAMVRITDAGRQTRISIDELMRERTSLILSAIPTAKRGSVLQALTTLISAMEKSGCCGFNAPTARRRRANSWTNLADIQRTRGARSARL
ncbi:MAG TPA: MarR family transcriptional regulator [Clostridia bacterium]|nr:MarR family transcriptional regulator [Clostridia bacterium]